jgi:hypothetical protein
LQNQVSYGDKVPLIKGKGGSEVEFLEVDEDDVNSSEQTLLMPPGMRLMHF